MGALSSMFVSMTDITNSVTIICVLFSFFAMALLFMKSALILRGPNRGMGGVDEPQWTSPTAPRVPRLRMTRVHIPFTFRVLDSTNSEPYNELRCAVSSRVAYSLLAFWAVPIFDLHRALWRPWPELRSILESLAPSREDDPKLGPSDNFAACGSTKNQCEDGSCGSSNGGDRGEVSDGDVLFSGGDARLRGASPFGHAHREQRSGLAHEEKAMTLRPPWPGEPGPLGEPPRQDYPLVVLLKREDGTEEAGCQNADDTVALVNVVHLRDPVCPLPTSILGQYLKQASGQLSSLKQLYLATPGDCSAPAPASPQQYPVSADPAYAVSEQLCVVCQSFPLSRALLPCRHTCICAVCFGKLDRCPMCRAPISSFFTIRAEDYVPQASVSGHQAARSGKGGAAVWLDALNDRLTDFLGFR